jgi:enoyl-CoA hydratase
MGEMYPGRPPGQFFLLTRPVLELHFVMDFPFFEIELNGPVARLYLNRPDRRNAMNWPFWRDLEGAVRKIEAQKEVKVVLVCARGKSFTTGLDLEEFFEQFKDTLTSEIGEKREELRNLILVMQSGFRAMMQSRLIFIACVHKHCIGGGLDLICACDLRLGTADAAVSLRETRVAIVADMGSLNRLPAIVGDGNTRLMAFTGRDFSGTECKQMGLFSYVYESQEAMMKAAEDLAQEIAANPGIVLRGVKHNINFQQDHTTAEGMDYVATFNAAMLDTRALREMMAAFKERRRPNFE